MDNNLDNVQNVLVTLAANLKLYSCEYYDLDLHKRYTNNIKYKVIIYCESTSKNKERIYYKPCPKELACDKITLTLYDNYNVKYTCQKNLRLTGKKAQYMDLHGINHNNIQLFNTDINTLYDSTIFFNKIIDRFNKWIPQVEFRFNSSSYDNNPFKRAFITLNEKIYANIGQFIETTFRDVVNNYYGLDSRDIKRALLLHGLDGKEDDIICRLAKWGIFEIKACCISHAQKVKWSTSRKTNSIDDTLRNFIFFTYELSEDLEKIKIKDIYISYQKISYKDFVSSIGEETVRKNSYEMHL